MILWPAAVAFALSVPLPASPPPSAAAALPAATVAAAAATASGTRAITERAVLAELNRARADPAGYAGRLGEYRTYYRDRLVAVPGAPVLYETQEGVAPVDEAIAFLGRAATAATLAPAPVLAVAAGDHRAEQERDGAVGHAGADGSTPGQRVSRRGGGAYVGEVIAYGSDSAVDMVRQLIVDDGVPDRSHRALLFDPDLRFAGVSCGPHPIYRTACVIDLARTEDGQSRFAAVRRRDDRRLAQVSRAEGRAGG